jgi:hypothetical protein
VITWWDQWIGDVVAEVFGLLTCALFAIASWQWWRGAPQNVGALVFAIMTTFGGVFCLGLLGASLSRMVRKTTSHWKRVHTLDDRDFGQDVRSSEA